MLDKYRQAFAGNAAWQFSTAGFIARLLISYATFVITLFGRNKFNTKI